VCVCVSVDEAVAQTGVMLYEENGRISYRCYEEFTREQALSHTHTKRIPT